MRVFRVRRHFLYLAIGSVVPFALLADLTPTWLTDWSVFYPSVGIVHAMALMLALNQRGDWPRRILFVVVTAVISGAVPFIALGIGNIAWPPLGFFGAFAAGSAIGALLYWILLRFLWIPKLDVESARFTVGTCTVASLASLILATVINGFGARRTLLSDALPTLAWWFAFSASIFLRVSALHAVRGRAAHEMA